MTAVVPAEPASAAGDTPAPDRLAPVPGQEAVRPTASGRWTRWLPERAPEHWGEERPGDWKGVRRR